MSFETLSTLHFLYGTLLSLVHLSLVFLAAGCFARGVFGGERAYIRSAVMLVAAFWLPVAIFAVLIPFGLFDRVWVTAALAFVAGASWLSWGRRIHNDTLATSDLRNGLQSLRDLWRPLNPWTKVVTLAVLVVFLVRLARGLIAPPLAWDALTYHLLKAGRWVQTGGWVWDDAPDAWQFYEWFPPLGDVYWAWAMLGTHTDAWLALAGALILLACGTATFSLARVLNAGREMAWLAALAALSVPASLAMLTAAYVDSTAMAVVIAGSALCLSAAIQRDHKLAAVSTVAMALAVGIKITFLPYLLLSGAVMVWLCLRAGRRGLTAAILALPATALCLFWQIYLLAIGRTPFYPAPFSVAGIVIEPGQPEFLVHHFPDKLRLPYLWEMPKSVWAFLFSTEIFSPTHLNYTWTFPLVLAAGVWGLVGFWKSQTGLVKWVLLGIFGAGAVIFLQFWLPSTAYYRGIWLSNMGRFFLPWYGLLVVLAATQLVKYRQTGFALVILVSAFTAWPRAWVWLDWRVTLVGLALLAIAMLAAVCLTRFRNMVLRLTLGILFFIPFAAGTILTRDLVRYDFYQNTDEVYDTIHLGGSRVPGKAAELLDQDPSQSLTINFTADYGGAAYRWFRYIFLGSRLQNNVVYVSPTVDGSVWSKSVTELKNTDYTTWRNRLDQAGVDYIVTITPFASELDWLSKHPDDFKLIAREPLKQNWALIKILHDDNTNYLRTK